MDKRVKKPYRPFMKYFDDLQYPSMALDSADITEESVYRAADELLKSHMYSAKIGSVVYGPREIDTVAGL